MSEWCFRSGIEGFGFVMGDPRTGITDSDLDRVRDGFDCNSYRLVIVTVFNGVFDQFRECTIETREDWNRQFLGTVDVNRPSRSIPSDLIGNGFDDRSDIHGLTFILGRYDPIQLASFLA